MVMGNPERKLHTVKPTCPICGREGLAMKAGFFECPIHGFLEKTPPALRQKHQGQREELTITA